MGRGELCVLSWTHRSWSLHCKTPMQWTRVSPVGRAGFFFFVLGTLGEAGAPGA